MRCDSLVLHDPLPPVALQPLFLQQPKRERGLETASRALFLRTRFELLNYSFAFSTTKFADGFSRISAAVDAGAVGSADLASNLCQSAFASASLMTFQSMQPSPRRPLTRPRSKPLSNAFMRARNRSS